MDLTDKSLKLTARQTEVIHELGIYAAEELLTWYPIRYDVLNAIPFDEWRIKDDVAFEGKVVSPVKSWRHGRLTTSRFDVEAFDRILKITIFNRPWAKNLRLDERLTIRGVYQGNNRLTATAYDTKPLTDHQALTPVYSTKAGIRQPIIRESIRRVYNALAPRIKDEIPAEFIGAYRLLTKREALRLIHFPACQSDVEAALRTLKYEEFLKYFTAVTLMRSLNTGIEKKPRLFDREKINRLIARLPFALTDDQNKAVEDILGDMAKSLVMYRLLQGDVGCGKTVVAGIGLYAAALAGYQGALLAPTEILARQHYSSITELLKDTDIKTEVLYSGLSNGQKENIYKGVREGRIDILIGTHALIQERVVFARLGFVAADEQQRFGVAQRSALKDKGKQVDFLVMSATPIPRTLASTLFGDMDVSTIETMPAGRRDPVTVFIGENSFRSVLSDVKNLLNAGHQLYVICAAVQENEDYDARNVTDTAQALSRALAPFKVGVLHGRMNSEEKQDVMNAFYRDDIQVLVATTVVEVGMNVVNATGMIIYDADRFGLSQLHQLRGRIQRGSSQGYCWLLSGSDDSKAKERLNALAKTNDGFKIAYEDLRLRGPGDILGKRQSGMPYLVLGNLIADTKIMNQARTDAAKIIRDPDNPDYVCLLDEVRRRNRDNAEYAD